MPILSQEEMEQVFANCFDLYSRHTYFSATNYAHVSSILVQQLEAFLESWTDSTAFGNKFLQMVLCSLLCM